MVRPEEDKNDAIMQRRISQENQRQGGEKRHELAPGEEATAEDMDQRHVPGADRLAGHTRWKREPYPGEIVGNKEPPFEVVGVDALSPLLTHVEFPATRDEIVERIGEARIPVTKERAKTVREVLDEVTPTKFDSRSAVEEAVKQAWEIIAEREGRGGRQKQQDSRWAGGPKKL